MPGRVFSAVMFILLLTSTLTLAFHIQPVRAEGTIYIRADGNIDPPAAPISTLDNVTYVFADNINNSIIVERDDIVVNGAGYTVQGTGVSGSKGICLSGRSNVTIKNVIIRYFWEGIILEYSSNNVLSENKVTNNSFGICLEDSSNNSLNGNNITANDNGVILEFSSNNVLRNNKMLDNEYDFGVSGYLSQFENDVDVSNKVEGKPIYYWVNEADRIVPMDAGCVVLINSTRITVQNLNLTKNLQGIRLVLTTDSTIAENSITDSYNGIRLDYSSNNSISGNNITNSSDGIYLVESSNDNTIGGNNITSNIRYGIMVYGYSNNNSISGNTVANSFEGIYLGGPGGSNNSVSENNVTANVLCGIRLYYSSGNNSISGNHIANNQYGIGLEGSSGNIFYHNNFSNSINQVYSSDSMNVWDDGYPSGGNYWSDYTGTDFHSGPYQNETGSDGIGDAPYVIDASNFDRYPLMYSYGATATEMVILPDENKFYANVTPPGSIFRINVTVSDVTDLATWQLNLTWDPTLLDFSNVVLPPDHILAGQSYFSASDVEIGSVVYGVALGPGGSTFNGTGILCQIELKILTGPNPSTTTCNLTLADKPVDTFLLDSRGNDISFTTENATFTYVQPQGSTGDLNLDGTVDISDAILAGSAFGSYPGHPNWDSQADLNQDNIVNILDLIILASNFGKH